jgi:anti-sigma regulatory factor (Ser/Thr protein kinase)
MTGMAAVHPMLSSAAPWLQLDVDHASAAVEARRVVTSIGQRVGLDETMIGSASIIVNELSTNLVKHATHGVLFIHGAGDHVDIVAVDRGPGVRDIGASMRDGHSTTGTAGNGLGALRRLATKFDIQSTPGRGTAVFARLSATPPSSAFLAGAFWRPMQIDDLCGDACVVFERGDEIVCIVADGLGHGVSAAEASRAAITVAMNVETVEPVRILERMHAALRSTRGAAIAVAVISPKQGAVRFAGIGNISASIRQNDASKSLVSLSGIVGHQVRSYQEFRYDWQQGATLVMHSDGLTSRWTLDEPGLVNRHPAIIAAVLARDFARERDDRCVVVVRQEPS